MRFGIDASRAAYTVRTGTENYSLELIRALLAALDDMRSPDRLVLYTGQRLPVDVMQSASAAVRQIPLPRLWTHLRLSAEMALHCPDVLFVPAHVIPVVHPKASVATIHDLGHLYFPEAYPKATLRYLDWATRHNVRCAAHLLADSQATKVDLVERMGVEPERVTVVYPGVARQFFEPVDPAAAAAVRQRYQLEGPYLLYVGTLQPRKNVERLIEAFALAKQRRQIEERLVLAGRIGWLPEGILQRLQQLGQQVTLAGYVPDEDLPALYSGATAVTLPSLYEGFGLPLAEAMATGAYVIGSTAGSLPEVVGDTGALVPPENTEELAEALAWACTHAEARVRLAELGRQRAARFNWGAAANDVLAVLRRVASQRRGLAVRW
jgi:glycosyltransferase involved in cell wall biosynthesis